SHLLASFKKLRLYFVVFVPGICTSSISAASRFNGVPCHVCIYVVCLGLGIHKGSRLLDTQNSALAIKNNHLIENSRTNLTILFLKNSISLPSTLQYILYS